MEIARKKMEKGKSITTPTQQRQFSQILIVSHHVQELSQKADRGITSQHLLFFSVKRLWQNSWQGKVKDSELLAVKELTR